MNREGGSSTSFLPLQQEEVRGGNELPPDKQWNRSEKVTAVWYCMLLFEVGGPFVEKIVHLFLRS